MNQLGKYLPKPKPAKKMVQGRIPADLKEEAEVRMLKQNLSWADVIEAAARMLVDRKNR